LLGLAAQAEARDELVWAGITGQSYVVCSGLTVI
jgi:hypothetical protein